MSGTPKTLGLAFIAKTQAEADQLIERYGRYFDDIFFQVGTVTDFSQARNAVLARTTTDYWFWFDTDDEVVGLENIRALVESMAARGIDALYMPYEYAYNEQGECVVLQWRERLLRTAHAFRWLGRVHESAISTSSPLLDRSEDIIIKHHKTLDEHTASAERNHKILVEEHKKAERDPRITHYLALSFFNKGDHKKAIKLFLQHIRTSGWDEDQYRSWFYIGQAYGILGDNDQVLWAAGEAVKLIPSRPEAYVLAATAEFEKRNFLKTLEWLKNASIKEPPRNSLSAIDPTYYSYKAEFLAAQAYLNLGRIKEAYEQIKLVLQHSPQFPAAVAVAPLFQELYDDEVAVTRIQWLVDYLRHYKGRPERILEALPMRLLADPRLNPTRSALIKPKQWSSRSIVFFSGVTAEQWGPDTLSKGMGGSEEAVIYLSRELTKLGWEVTVYCDREEEYWDDLIGDDGIAYNLVRYKPWTLFNPNDEFNVVIAWRSPTFFRITPVKAKFRGIDLHDLPSPQDFDEATLASVDKLFFKSQYQRNLVAGIPNDKAVVISNGVVTEQFNHKVKRNLRKVVYGSSADRGLECLLGLWPRVKEQVPEAELHWYYGWDTYDKMHQGNPQMGKLKWDIIRRMHNVGAIDHGRVDHETLAQAYLSAGVWAYPTEFGEINCMTALKTQLAGCTPVTTGCAALQETVLDDEEDYGATIYNSQDRQDQFVSRLVRALKQPETEAERKVRALWVEENFNWQVIAKEWEGVLYEAGIGGSRLPRTKIHRATSKAS